MSITLKIIGIFGVILFGILMTVTFMSPEKIEQSAKGFVQYKIEKEVRETQEAITESSTAQAALSVAEKLGFEKEQIQSDLENELPKKIASIIAAMCGYDCEKKKIVAESIATGYLDRIKNIKVAESTLNDVIKGRYLEIVGNLKLDLRIFLGSNLAMFIILLAVSFAKPKAIQHLFLPGILLLVATVVSSFIYIFGQDWFYTIIYNDYMGFTFLAYIGVIFAFLLDIIFNKARVTTEIINAITNALGSALSVVPC